MPLVCKATSASGTLSTKIFRMKVRHVALEGIDPQGAVWPEPVITRWGGGKLRWTNLLPPGPSSQPLQSQDIANA